MLKQLILNLAFAVWNFIVLCALTFYYFFEAFVLTIFPFLKKEKSLKNKTVLITGGAGGVGQELALRLARLKANVVVWDVNEKAIEKLRTRISNDDLKIRASVVDITDRHSVYKHADLVKSEVGPVDVLINNAGIVAGQTFLEIPDELIEKTFEVNVISHYWTIKAFLGDMIQRGQGHIVSVGSLTGMLGTYKCTDYSATKYALNGLHESLSTELKTHGHDNIHMTLICPYFINTGMFAGCNPRNMSMLEPKDVAKRIITAIKREESFITMPFIARLVLPLKHYLPTKLAWAVMFRVIQGPQSMIGLNSRKDTAAA
ncbi:hypothetical protein RN001_013537 [Aquatica leii]|uniref:Short-chain dehydrogenase/reductase 3 n=1 Tax=Aquatica leii TaxID=1421715 RepID=A0AAN7PRW0_9COLE|nr:hypothetical protein RN001_013537 [Aquatica leii]